MAKGKSLGQNPVEAHRKMQKAKQFKRNKEQKDKAKETANIKKDTGGLEAEVRRLSQEESAGTLDKTSLARLTALRADLTKIKAAKDAYLLAHPEHRHLVYKERPSASSSSKAEGDEGRGPIFDRKGRLRDPKRSVYYDQVLNPFGVPPPGMPYRERSLPPDEEEESDEDEDDSDDEIVMPEGPPPDSDEDSDDSIVMPEGPPPPEAKLYPSAGEASSSGTSGGMPLLPPGPPPNRPPFHPFNAARPHFNPNFPRPPFLPRHGNFPIQSRFQPGFQPGFPGYHGGPRPPLGQIQQQPPPPGFFPPGGAAITSIPPRPFMPNQARPMQAGATHDPLSNSPHQTFQARRAEHAAAGLPERPGSLGQNGDSIASSSAPPASAIISAEPQLRNLRQEAAAFVPRGVKRKKVATTTATGGTASNERGEQQADGDGQPSKATMVIDSAPMVITAAPPTDSTNTPSTSFAFGGGLLGKLSSVLGPSPAEHTEKVVRQAAEANVQAEPKQGDDYRAFLAGLEELK